MDYNRLSVYLLGIVKEQDRELLEMKEENEMPRQELNSLKADVSEIKALLKSGASNGGK